ncbi:hypothetical protein LCGC14_2617310, partial [marine sediment metagenome]
AKIPSKDINFDEALSKSSHREKVEIVMPRLEAERLEYLSENFEPNDTWWGSKVTID